MDYKAELTPKGKERVAEFFRVYHEKRNRLLQNRADTAVWSPVPAMEDILLAIAASAKDEHNIFVRSFNCTDHTICMLLLDKNTDFILREA